MGHGTGQAVAVTSQAVNQREVEAARATVELNRKLKEIEGSLQAIKMICCCILLAVAMLVFVK